MHPMVGSLEKISDSDLDEKIIKIYKVIAMSPNMNITRQAQMALDNYLTEQQARLSKKLDEQFKKSGKKVKDIINIE